MNHDYLNKYSKEETVLLNRFDLQVQLTFHMSIYSGFATRFQEQSYDHCIDALLYVLQKRIIKFYMGEQAEEEKFISVVTRLHHQMQKMEKNKYLDPKSSESVRELIHFMKVYQSNIIGNIPQGPSQSQKTTSIKENQPIFTPQQHQTEMKKVSYWVERMPKKQEHEEPVVKDMESFQPASNDRPTQSSRQKQGGVEFKRTTYHNRSIRGVHMKKATKINKTREKEEERSNSSLLGANKITKVRASSNYLRQKPPIFSQKTGQTPVNESIGMINRRLSNSKATAYGLVPGELKPAASKDEVADIIRQYIMKNKKNKKIGTFSRANVDYLNKLNDF